MWSLEKPERFEEDWVMVAVPKGRRNLIIATHVSLGVLISLTIRS